jgi:Na+/H+-translocating membrane pyrophosphatase
MKIQATMFWSLTWSISGVIATLVGAYVLGVNSYSDILIALLRSGITTSIVLLIPFAWMMFGRTLGRARSGGDLFLASLLFGSMAGFGVVLIQMLTIFAVFRNLRLGP